MFGGLLGGIFGGGKTTVTQESQNKTDVKVETNLLNEITVDTTQFAQALTAAAELANSGQVVLAAGIVHAAQEKNKSDQEAMNFVTKAWEQVSKFGKWLVWIAILAVVAWFFMKGSK